MKQRKNPILFSIVIANYNYGRFLSDALESIIGQCEGDCVCTSVDGRNRLKLPSGELVEIIVCDGASTDNSIDVIKQYANKITWWCSEKDGGQSAAFNKGFAQAKGRFLTWLNADDILVSGALRRVLDQIRLNPSCRWFVGTSFWADEKLTITRCFCSHRFSKIRAKACMLSANGPSSFFARDLYERAGGFLDQSLHFCMDTDLWYRFYLQCHETYSRILRPVFVYRIHRDSKMSGADVAITEQSIRNRQIAREEGCLIASRNGLDYDCNRFLAKLLSFSIVDMFIRVYYTIQYKGKSAHEV